MMLFDSQSTKSPSLMVGTKPLGFMAAYSGSLLPPNFPPQSRRSNCTPSSPQHQSTFCTFEESVRPQILIIVASVSGSFAALLIIVSVQWVAPLAAVVSRQFLLGVTDKLSWKASFG